MPINVKAQKEVKQPEFIPELYSGVFKFIPKIINPTNEEFAKVFGHKRFNNEPQYITDIVRDDGKPGKQIRLDICGHIYPENEDAREYTITLFIRNTEKKSNTGKYQYIDTFGNTVWDADGNFTNLTISSFDTSSCRKSFFGEAELIEFLKRLNGIKDVYLRDGETDPRTAAKEEYQLYFDNDELKSIFSGNIKPITDMFAFPIKNENPINVLIGTREYTDKKSGDIKKTNCIYTSRFLSGAFSIYSAVDRYAKQVQKYCSQSETYEVVSGYIIKADNDDKPITNTINAIPEINTKPLEDIEEDDVLPF